MSGTTRKTDYFGTFLDTFRANTASGGPAPVPTTPAPLPRPSTGLDGALLALRHAGDAGLPIKDLIARFDNSLDAAFDALGRLESLGLVIRVGEGFALTAAGVEAAGALKV